MFLYSCAKKSISMHRKHIVYTSKVIETVFPRELWVCSTFAQEKVLSCVVTPGETRLIRKRGATDFLWICIFKEEMPYQPKRMHLSSTQTRLHIQTWRMMCIRALQQLHYLCRVVQFNLTWKPQTYRVWTWNITSITIFTQTTLNHFYMSLCSSDLLFFAYSRIYWCIFPFTEFLL